MKLVIVWPFSVTEFGAVASPNILTVSNDDRVPE